MSKLGIIEPEYMTWSLKKLQQEYFKLNLNHAVTRIHNSREIAKLEKVDRFIEALKDLLDEEQS